MSQRLHTASTTPSSPPSLRNHPNDLNTQHLAILAIPSRNIDQNDESRVAEARHRDDADALAGRALDQLGAEARLVAGEEEVRAAGEEEGVVVLEGVGPCLVRWFCQFGYCDGGGWGRARLCQGEGYSQSVSGAVGATQRQRRSASISSQRSVSSVLA